MILKLRETDCPEEVIKDAQTLLIQGWKASEEDQKQEATKNLVNSLSATDYFDRLIKVPFEESD